MADELKGDPDDLDGKAAMIEGIAWGDDPTAVTVSGSAGTGTIGTTLLTASA